MSKTKQVLELSSPTVKTKHEHIVGMAQRCNYCSGGGWFWGTDEWGERVKEPCPMCGGAGAMVPEITVDWKPVRKAPPTP